MPRSASRLRRSAVIRSTMRSISSSRSGRKSTMSSTRLRNSGRKCARSSRITASRAASRISPRSVIPSSRWWLPMFAGHDDHRVLEVHGAPLRVGEPAVVEDLQQHVEDVVVRLLDLVEEHHRVGLAAHRLGELAALLVADVARRRADQPRHGVLLHVLGHVDAHHVLLAVEERLGERLRELGLADAGGAEEDERADRPPRVLDPGAGADHRVGDQLHRLVLADHALVQDLVEAQQLLALALDQPRHRDAGPLRDDLGDLVLGDLLAQQLVAAAVDAPPPPRCSCASSCGSWPCVQLRRAVQVVLRAPPPRSARRTCSICSRSARTFCDRGLLGLPLGAHARRPAPSGRRARGAGPRGAPARPCPSPS